MMPGVKDEMDRTAGAKERSNDKDQMQLSAAAASLQGKGGV